MKIRLAGLTVHGGWLGLGKLSSSSPDERCRSTNRGMKGGKLLAVGASL